MKLTSQGAHSCVECDETDVSKFAAAWPCFGDPRSLAFTFDRRNGDLIDVAGADGLNEPGVLALSNDAQAWANTRTAS